MATAQNTAIAQTQPASSQRKIPSDIPFFQALWLFNEFQHYYAQPPEH